MKMPPWMYLAILLPVVGLLVVSPRAGAGPFVIWAWWGWTQYLQPKKPDNTIG